MELPDKVYDILKWVAQIVLPAIGALYFGLCAIWGFPYGEQVVGTITVVDTFLGAILGISSTKYNGDGTLQVDTSDPKVDRYSLDMDVPLNLIKDKKNVILRVNKK